MKLLRWIAANFWTFVLALAMAIAVWVSSVSAADPDVVQEYPNPIAIEFIGQDPALINVGNIAKQINATLRAPRSVWTQLTDNPETVRAIVDLTGLSAGRHTLTVQLQITASPVRVVTYSPAAIEITLEPLITRTLPLKVDLIGAVALGYEAGTLSLDPPQVTLAGPESLMQKVDHVQAEINISDRRTDVTAALTPRIVNANGQNITGLTLSPEKVNAKLPIRQQGGYRDLAVKVLVTGQVASGYRLDNITVTPLIITVYSSDLELVNSLPGFVETTPFDLTDANQDFEARLALTLPAGVSLVGEQSVLVQAGVSAIESSLTLSNRPVEIIGLGKGLSVALAPQTVDVILSGPLPVLDQLDPNEVQVVVDLTGLAAGTYQLTPRVEFLVNGIRVATLNPATVEVVISLATPTPTP
jgi:YbbR domain-containing protein